MLITLGRHVLRYLAAIFIASVAVFTLMRVVPGDPAAVEIVTEAGHWLGQGIADICAILDPSIVVVGGGVAQVGAALLDPARVRFGQVLTGRGFREHATIVGAKLGVHAGIIGAAYQAELDSSR